MDLDLWPFLLVRNEVGLLSLVGVVVAAAAGYRWIEAVFRPPGLTVCVDRITVQRSLVGGLVRVRWDETTRVDVSRMGHRLVVDFKDPKVTKGLPTLVGEGAHTLCPTAPNRVRSSSGCGTRLRTNIGNVATLDDAAALNQTERRKGETVVSVRP